MKQKKCIVEYRPDAPNVPWAVIYGERMVVSRHELREVAERVRDKLNMKIERSNDVAALALRIKDTLA
jgi:hypothetical protein